jgi:hypothetical protein
MGCAAPFENGIRLCARKSQETNPDKVGIGTQQYPVVLACRGVWVTPGEACDAVYVRTAT